MSNDTKKHDSVENVFLLRGGSESLLFFYSCMKQYSYNASSSSGLAETIIDVLCWIDCPWLSLLMVAQAPWSVQVLLAEWTVREMEKDSS